MPKMFVYSVDPIDDWAGWHEPEAFFLEQTSWQEMWDATQEQARDLGWDGTIRDGPCMTILPLPFPQCVLIAWQQEDDGVCYIAAPFEIPWL